MEKTPDPGEELRSNFFEENYVNSLLPTQIRDPMPFWPEIPGWKNLNWDCGINIPDPEHW
jgi:hypothetical protein